MTPPNDDPAALPEERRKAEPIDTRLVRRLADILRDTDLSEIEVARGDLKVRVVRAGGPFAPSAGPVSAAPPPAVAGVEPTPSSSGSATAPGAAAAKGDTVNSPMVGTVYLQPQPGAAAFVKPGDRVSQGQTLVLIEAMKTMNPVAAPRSGTVIEVLVGDAQPVEFGEPLVVIE